MLDETLQNPPFSFSIYREQSDVNRSRNYGTTGTGDRQSACISGAIAPISWNKRLGLKGDRIMEGDALGAT
jgi:hypothetical protein